MRVGLMETINRTWLTITRPQWTEFRQALRWPAQAKLVILNSSNPLIDNLIKRYAIMRIPPPHTDNSRITRSSMPNKSSTRTARTYPRTSLTSSWRLEFAMEVVCCTTIPLHRWRP